MKSFRAFLTESLTDKQKEVFKRSFGFDTDTGKLLSIETKKHECPKCKGKNAYMRTSGEDTSYEEHYLYCPDCKKSSEME